MKDIVHIAALRANVSQEDALRQFAGGVSGRIAWTLFGPLRALARIYVPFRLFKVVLTNNGTESATIVGLEAVNGNLDLFRFDKNVLASQIVTVSTRNRLEPVLDENRGSTLVLGKIRRALYCKGFWTLRQHSIVVTPLERIIYVPYWLGFRGTGSRARISGIDAVRRQLEGAKLRELVTHHLSPNATPQFDCSPAEVVP